jgi:hypothetical protein
MMYPTIDNPASCEIRVFIFIQSKYISTAKIRRELCAAIYGQNAITEGSLSQ